LAALYFALTRYEFLIQGSNHPITIYTDQKPIIFLFSKKAAVNQQFHKYQLTFNRFINLHIKCKKGSDIPWADLFSRNQTEQQKLQCIQSQKEIQKDIKFFDQNDEEITYYVQYEEREKCDQQDSHPILVETKHEKYIIQMFDKGTKIIQRNVTDIPMNKLLNVRLLFQIANQIMKNNQISLYDTNVYEEIDYTSEEFLKQKNKQQEEYSEIESDIYRY